MHVFYFLRKEVFVLLYRTVYEYNAPGSTFAKTRYLCIKYNSI